jgi:hypothetical protein
MAAHDIAGADMAKRTIRKKTKSRTASSTSFRAIKKKAKEKAVVAKKTSTKRIARLAPTGREAKSDEHLREVAAWYRLQGVDEATARQLAQNEIDDDIRKD